jgi:hypothetical protein
MAITSRGVERVEVRPALLNFMVILKQAVTLKRPQDR